MSIDPISLRPSHAGSEDSHPTVSRPIMDVAFVPGCPPHFQVPPRRSSRCNGCRIGRCPASTTSISPWSEPFEANRGICLARRGASVRRWRGGRDAGGPENGSLALRVSGTRNLGGTPGSSRHDSPVKRQSSKPAEPIARGAHNGRQGRHRFCGPGFSRVLPKTCARRSAGRSRRQRMPRFSRKCQTQTRTLFS